jgi:hypothetical protein
MPDRRITSGNLRRFPAAAQEAAAKTTVAREKRSSAARDVRSRKAAELADRADAKLRRLLGKRVHAELRELMDRERLALRDALQPPGGLEASLDRESAAKRRKADAFLRRRKVDRSKLAAIAAEYHAGVADILVDPAKNVTEGFHLEGNLDKWLKLSPLHIHPLPWGVYDPDPGGWEVHRPPFFGFNFGFEPLALNNFAVDWGLTLDPSLGDVGMTIFMDTQGDETDWDLAQGIGFSVVAVGFVPPRAGLVEVLIDAQSIQCDHRLRTGNCWGWSDSTTTQVNFLALDVLHPNVAEPSYAAMSTFAVHTDADRSYHEEYLNRGQHYFAQLFSAGPVPAGQHVIVCAGTRSLDKSFADDMSIHSKSEFRWFISSLEVRIAP